MLGMSVCCELLTETFHILFSFLLSLSHENDYFRLWWTVSVIIFLYLCITLVVSAYEKWQKTPVIVSFERKETSNWQIPFSAVTRCPENNIVPRKSNYTNYLLRKKRDETVTANMGVYNRLKLNIDKHIYLWFVFFFKCLQIFFLSDWYLQGSAHVDAVPLWK